MRSKRRVLSFSFLSYRLFFQPQDRWRGSKLDQGDYTHRKRVKTIGTRGREIAHELAADNTFSHEKDLHSARFFNILNKPLDFRGFLNGIFKIYKKFRYNLKCPENWPDPSRLRLSRLLLNPITL